MHICQQRVDRADLYAVASAMIAQTCGIDVIGSIQNDERQRGKAFDDLILDL